MHNHRPAVARAPAGRPAFRKRAATSAGISFVLLMIPALPGCQSARPVVEIQTTPSSPAHPGIEQAAFRPSDGALPTDSVHLAAMIGEITSFRLAIRAPDAPVEGPSWGIGPLISAEGIIDAGNIRLFREHAVEVTSWPGWHIRSVPPQSRDSRPLDVLVPLAAPRGGMPARLVPGETYHFWVDVSIPKGTPPGEYEGLVRLQSEKQLLAASQIKLTVYPLVLADEIALPMIAELDHVGLFHHHLRSTGGGFNGPLGDWIHGADGERATALLGRTMGLLQDHGLTPVLPDLSPAVSIDARDGLSIDWGSYDELVSPFLSGKAFANRLPSAVWPLPLRNLLERATMARSPHSADSERWMRRMVTDCAEHFEQRGWLEKAYLFLSPFPSPHGATDEVASILRSAEARVPIAVRNWPQDMTPYGWQPTADAPVTDQPDIWAPPAQFYDPEALTQQRAQGRRTWLTIDRPPYGGTTSICGTETDVRVIPWQAKQLGAQAVFLGRANDWPDDADRTSADECIRHDDRVLLYPGTPFGLNEPVASVRLKHLRRGIHDLAYVGLLEDHGLAPVAKRVVNAVSWYAGAQAYRAHFADGRPQGWADDPAAFELGRTVMVNALTEQHAGPGDPSDRSRFKELAALRRFEQSVDQVRLSGDGTRIRTSSGTTAWAAEFEAGVTVLNRTNQPIQGEWRTPTWPADWGPRVVRPADLEIPAYESRRATVFGRLTAPPTGTFGVHKIPIEYRTSSGKSARTTLRACFVVAVSTLLPIRIDGDLSDWPPGAVNVAGDFRLISPPLASDNDGETATSPTHQTLVFVLRDSAHLYVAVNSRWDGGTRPSLSADNRVSYEDMIPVGDELIEVLLDPLNAGTRSPQDLFHIAVKPSGTYLSERGIRLSPPCGRREAWPADLEVATSASAERWTAEVKIPLQSLDGAATERVIWGFNVTRNDRARQEFSTWSGAVGNAYDPLSMGNLYLP